MSQFTIVMAVIAMLVLSPQLFLQHVNQIAEPVTEASYVITSLQDITEECVTIQNAGVILVVRDGDIVERGNHKELLAQNGFYTSRYNSQFDAVG